MIYHDMLVPSGKFCSHGKKRCISHHVTKEYLLTGGLPLDPPRYFNILDVSMFGLE